MSRRVLLIAYFFPPEPSSGAQRPGALAKFLPELGWEVEVIARNAPSMPVRRSWIVPHRYWIERLRGAGVRPDLWFRAPPPESWTPGVVEKPRGLLARAYGLVRASALQVLTWPDRSIGWYPRALRAARRDLGRDPPDAIVSTSPPETTHLIARRLAKVTGAPWLADLRDPWSDTEMLYQTRWRKRLDRWTERRVLRDAGWLTTVSEPIAESLRALHGHLRVSEIRNGFDPDLFPGPAAVDRSKFTIGYTGSITPGKHDFVTFFEGLARFLDARPARPPIALEFLGETSVLVRRQAERFGIAGLLRQRARVGHDEAVAAIRTNAVNLFLMWQDPEHPGVYSGKLFEYLGARRPILGVGAIKGVAGALLEETGCGRCAQTPAEVAARLDELWSAHEKSADAWRGDEQKILRFSHREMAKAFAARLDALVAAKPQG